MSENISYTQACARFFASAFCTVDGAAERGGVKGKLAEILRGGLTSAGFMMFGVGFMLDLKTRGQDGITDYYSEY